MLAMIEDRDKARDIGTQYALLPADHSFFSTEGDYCSGNSSSQRWSLTSQSKEWLVSLAEESDVERVLLWVMSQYTGVPLGDPDFEPMALRRRKGIPLITLPEMFGME